MIRAIAAILIMLALAGLWWHGYVRGEKADKQRSDLVIAGMVNEAQAKVAAESETNRLVSASIQRKKEDAERGLQAERQRNERRLADQRATDVLVRDELAKFASGAGAGDNPESTCRSDARTLGNVLGVVLQDLGVCTAGAEAEAAGARAVLDAWPVTK